MLGSLGFLVLFGIFLVLKGKTWGDRVASEKVLSNPHR